MPFSERKYPIIKLASNKFDAVVFWVVIKKDRKKKTVKKDCKFD